jgi:hypothetical protein
MNLEQLYNYRDRLLTDTINAPMPFIAALYKTLLDDAEKQIRKYLDTHTPEGEPAE